MSADFKLENGMHMHLVGVGGSGISAIANVLLDRGYIVSGSDLQENEVVESLRERGAVVNIGHAKENISGAEALIVSSAIPEGNPELLAARSAGIPVMKRSDFLRYLMAGQIGIAVAGTHGKTTTTAMIAHILIETGQDPSIILGGNLPIVGGNGRAGSGDYFVIEADEYDYMFLGLRPDIEVITNIEHDHPDIYPTLADYLDAFCEFAALLPENGKLIVSGEDSGVAEMLREVKVSGVKVVTFGLAEAASPGVDIQLKATDYRSNQLGGTDFVVIDGDKTIGLVRLRVPGLHNVRNALAAIAVARELDLDFGKVCRALADFGGVGRRFQVIAEIGGVTIIDDYAHHPTEIQATLAAARQRYGERRLWAIWQPHTYSRTRLLLPRFATSFADADRVITLDIYRSRETDTLGMNTAEFASGIEHTSVQYIGQIDSAIEYLLDRIRPGDVVLTLGAGDSNQVGEGLVERLKVRVETYRP
ncbi:MAG: UDP-N-acetylmuramate--L-alanine ligase [Candidatus Promineifilaceae bacterium]